MVPMKPFFGPLSGAACALFLFAVSSEAAPAKASPSKALSTEERVKLEFKAWRYKGALLGASFARGPVFLLSLSSSDSLETVWKFYTGRVPVENNIPLALSWDIPGDNTVVGANTTLGSSYAVSLRSGPREGGTIVYQKGDENVVIEIRARTPEERAATGQATDIKFIKMRPLPPVPKEASAPATTPKTLAKAGESSPVQSASAPPSVW